MLHFLPPDSFLNSSLEFSELNESMNQVNAFLPSCIDALVYTCINAHMYTQLCILIYVYKTIDT